MLTLNEAWKKSYNEYLDETENSAGDIIEELLEATQEINKGFEYIAEYFNMLPIDEEIHSAEGADGPSDGRDDTHVGQPSETARRLRSGQDSNGHSSNSRSSGSNSKPKPKYSPEDITSYLLKNLGDKIIQNTATQTAAQNGDLTNSMPEYEVQGISTVEKISDRKFPKNIIFFIQQLIEWIKRIVVYFIEKIKNVFRALVNRPTKELNPDALKLKLERSKKLEQIIGVTNVSGKPQPIRVNAIKASDIDKYYALKGLKEDSDLSEGAIDDVLAKRESTIVKKQPVVISVDISKDLITLKELVQHFYDLYDNAFGSNNENLFKTDDLELILKLFKDTMYKIETGRADVYQVGSAAIDVEAINSGRVKDNLIRTNSNIVALKGAYMETSKMIQSVTNIISHKEFLMLSGYGIDRKWFSSATYKEIIEIANTIRPRLKDAAKNEKALTKMQKAYTNIANKLTDMQRAFMALSNVSYSSVYQRRIVDLCNSARYMTQIVTLRLTALTLYTKEIKDIRDVLIALSNVSNAK